MRAWKEKREAEGFTIRNIEGDGYIATRGNEKQAIILREYDKVTRERIHPPLPPLRTDPFQSEDARKRKEKNAAPKPRRGRKPVGV
jgi:hypothetical protein